MEKKSKMLIPVSKRLQELGANKSEDLFVNRIIFAKGSEDFTSYTSADIVLMSISTGDEDFSLIRETFYNLYYHGKDIKIVDIGNVIYSNSREDELEELFSLFIDSNCYIILFGSTPDAMPVYYRALNRTMERISISCITPTVSLDGYLGNLFKFSDQGLFDFNLIGHQLYLSNPKDLELITSKFYKSVRLGSIREDISIVEPFLRDAQLFCTDISAVRRIEAPSSKSPGPNGLYAEEICRLARYSAISEASKMAYIWGFDTSLPLDIQTSGLIAQIIWHLFDGFISRLNETVLKNVNTIVKFIVNSDFSSEDLIFYHSKISDRWWMEIPCDDNINSSIVACLLDDYKQAGENELPMRWIWYHQKMNLNKN